MDLLCVFVYLCAYCTFVSLVYSLCSFSISHITRTVLAETLNHAQPIYLNFLQTDFWYLFVRSFGIKLWGVDRSGAALTYERQVPDVKITNDDLTRSGAGHAI